ncbi:hypothetical protein EW146_g7029 [Bondarzewia mesenterica]|uniref:Phytanoyl-CoA dioxygenase n=1 Tax=Bondarzewia mesenterica TaxID=1095465 RepID=A0A4S4LNU5_9AGAM|nr:hypothetical protein EW146_g7029 [Bondarzewia mesenterica]
MAITLKERFDEQGFVIVPNLIITELRAELEQATENAISKTRSGVWPHRRVVGKQFPPYGNDGPDSWGVQHVMHPELGEPAFAKWYSSKELRGAVEELLACQDENLQMELFNLLINPESHEFALRWHRDDVKTTATDEEEREALEIWNHGNLRFVEIQWNTALYEDSCLFVVPGSHRVPRTDEQRSQSSTPDPPEDPMTMPGVLQVTLHPGDTVFYNNNILHCGKYSEKAKRATLHASMGDTRGGATRARNVLQHGLAWMKEEPFRKTLDKDGQGMLDRLIAMQEGVGHDIGYSQD